MLRRTLGGHTRWLIPLLCVPLIVLAGLWATGAIQSAPDYRSDIRLLLASSFVGVGVVLGVLAAVVFAIIGGVKTIRAWRRANGHFSSREQVVRVREAQHQEASSAAWSAAARLRARLIAREVPPSITVWEVVPYPDEVMFFDLRADYARYYGQDVTYSQGGGIFFGHPAFVLAGLAATSIGNAVRRSNAEAAAQTTWREWQPARVIVTNRRLLCHAGGRWLSFDYAGMTAVYPEVDRWTLICEFGDQAVPLLLSGIDAPVISVMTVLLTRGPDAVETHPSLRALA